MSPLAILTLGFLLGMRHATDADHVVAISTIVSRERSLRAAGPVGVLWGLGHTLTILLVGGAILLFGLVIPARVGLAMELAVAFMLLILGALTLRGLPARAPISPAGPLAGEGVAGHGHVHVHRGSSGWFSIRPLLVGIVHGLAGSAAIALLVLGTIRDPVWGVGYLAVFGAGTVAGMFLITTLLAVPMAIAGQRFARFQRALGVATGVASVAFGCVLLYETGFVHGLFTDHPQWTPE